MNVKQQGISGYWLKVIAVVSMLIDHTSAVILEQISGLENPAFLMRIIGRLAFPIYCFLLVEGFYHTRSRAKYAGRLFLFALISEVPFDLAFSRRMCDFSSSNVFFTLLFGLLVIWGVEGIKQKFVADVYGEKAAAIRVILIIVTVAAGGISGTSFPYRLRFVGNCDNFCNLHVLSEESEGNGYRCSGFNPAGKYH